MVLLAVIGLACWSQLGQDAPEGKPADNVVQLKCKKTIGSPYRWRSPSSFVSLDYHKQSSRLAAIDAEHTLHLWALEKTDPASTLKLSSTLQVSDLTFLGPHSLVVLFSNGKPLVVSHESGKWSKRGLAVPNAVAGEAMYAYRCDSRKELYITGGTAVAVVSIPNEKIVGTLASEQGDKATGTFRALVADPTGSHLYAAGRTITRWSLKTKKLMETVECESPVVRLSISADGKRLTSCHADQSVQVRKTSTLASPYIHLTRNNTKGQPVWAGTRPEDPDNVLVATQSGFVSQFSGTRRLYERPTGCTFITDATYDSQADCLFLSQALRSPLGTPSKVPGHSSRVMKIIKWDLSKAELWSGGLAGGFASISEMSASHPDKVVLARLDGHFTLLHTSTKGDVSAERVQCDYSDSANLIEKGRALSVVSRQQKALRWLETAGQRELHSIKFVTAPYKVVVSSQTPYGIAIGRQSFYVIDMHKRQVLKSHPSDEPLSTLVALSRNGRYVVFAYPTGLVEVRTLPGLKVQNLTRTNGPLLGLAYCRSDKAVLMSLGKSLTVWHWEGEREETWRVEGQIDAFAPLGDNRIAVAQGAAVAIIDLDTRATLAVGKGHLGLITDLSVSHDRQTLTSASEDGTFRMWATK